MVLFSKICISIALAVLILFVVLAVRNRRTATSRFSLMLAGICVSAFFLFLPAYADKTLTWMSEQGLEGKWFYLVIRTAAYSLYDSIKALGGGQEIGILEDYPVEGSAFRFLYVVMNYGYYVAAPVMTSGLILSMIGDTWDRIRWRIQYRSNYHVFSQLNEISLTLASRIREKQSGAVIVFCNTKGADSKLQAESRKLNALRLFAPCKTLPIPFGKKRMEFYLVSQSEDENLQTAELLIARLRNKKDCRIVINACASSSVGIQVVESMEKGSIGLRFFDGTALLCSNLLWRYPIYRIPEDRKCICVALLGCGSTGMQMLRTVSWCARMDGRDLKIRVYDRDPRVEERFRSLCPELSDSCDIAFCAVDVLNSSFEERFLDPCTGSPDATYCVVTLGDDEDNMAAAERIYRIFRGNNSYGWTPTILARVRNIVKYGVYSDCENDYFRKRNIVTFGGVEDALASDTLFHSCLERLSFAVNLCYCGLLPEQDPSNMTGEELRAYLSRKDIQKCREEFLHSEYFRRASMASALHIPVKLQSCGILREDGMPSDETARIFARALENDPELAHRLARNEHLRWNSFMRSEGYRSISWEAFSRLYPYVRNNQDPLGKRHLCITDWEELDARNRKYLELNPPTRKNFKKSDFDLIYGIPRIIMLTNRLMETGLDADM